MQLHYNKLATWRFQHIEKTLGALQLFNLKIGWCNKNSLFPYREKAKNLQIAILVFTLGRRYYPLYIFMHLLSLSDNNIIILTFSVKSSKNLRVCVCAVFCCIYFYAGAHCACYNNAFQVLPFGSRRFCFYNSVH